MVTHNGTLNYLARERWGPTLLRIVAIIRVITNWMPSTAISLKCLFVFFRVVECQFELSSRKGECVFCEQRFSRKSLLVQNHTSKPSGREELLLAISPLDLVASGWQQRLLSAGITACDFLSWPLTVLLLLVAAYNPPDIIWNGLYQMNQKWNMVHSRSVWTSAAVPI